MLEQFIAAGAVGPSFHLSVRVRHFMETVFYRRSAHFSYSAPACCGVLCPSGAQMTLERRTRCEQLFDKCPGHCSLAVIVNVSKPSGIAMCDGVQHAPDADTHACIGGGARLHASSALRAWPNHPPRACTSRLPLSSRHRHLARSARGRFGVAAGSAGS